MNVIEITAEKKPAQETIRLAAYCRVSSDSEDQLHSFAAQIRYYKDYERRHPQYKLVDIYADEGITGTCMDKRDDLHRLIRDCKKGLIDRIIVKSVSRFARNTQELLATIRLLKDIGVSIYFEEQGIDTDKLNSEMIVTFPGMAAQQESESISGNMRWSYKKRMESGDFNCCAPAYGFDLIDGSLVINETEAVVVRRIFSMYLQGYTQQDLYQRLPVQEGHDQQRRAAEILCREQSSRNHRLRLLRQSAGGNGKTERKAEGQAGRHENRARPLLQQVCAHRASDLRRMRNAISQMHLGSQRQEESGMAVHQPA